MRGRVLIIWGGSGEIEIREQEQARQETTSAPKFLAPIAFLWEIEPAAIEPDSDFQYYAIPEYSTPRLSILPLSN